MGFDLEKMLASKAAMRKRMAELPIREKFRMLDAMRERELMIRRATGRGDRGQEGKHGEVQRFWDDYNARIEREREEEMKREEQAETD